LQLTPNSSFQSIRGIVLAAGAVPQRWRSALLGAAEPPVRWAASCIIREMDHFIGLAELEIAFAGFAGVVVALNPSLHHSHVDRFRLWLLVTVSLLSVPLTLLPHGLSLAGLLNSDIARLSSGVWVLAFSPWAVFAISRAKRQPSSLNALLPLVLGIPLGVAGVANLVIQLLNATAWLLTPSISLFFFGIWYSIAFVAVVFGDIVLRRE
jgi:hypothetical protein